MNTNDPSLKLAMARLLPELIECELENMIEGNPNSNRSWYYYWKNTPAKIQINDTEFLYVVHLVEQSLTDTDYGEYMDALADDLITPEVQFPRMVAATFNQRALAICKVKGIELENKQ